MANAAQIREHMEVVDVDGEHVGIVDRVEGNRIKLTKDDPQAQGQHHYISLDMVEEVQQDAVQLNVSADEARQQSMGDDSSSMGDDSGSMGDSSSMGRAGGSM